MSLVIPTPSLIDRWYEQSCSKINRRMTELLNMPKPKQKTRKKAYEKTLQALRTIDEDKCSHPIDIGYGPITTPSGKIYVNEKASVTDLKRKMNWNAPNLCPVVTNHIIDTLAEIVRISEYEWMARDSPELRQRFTNGTFTRLTKLQNYLWDTVYPTARSKGCANNQLLMPEVAIDFARRRAHS